MVGSKLTLLLTFRDQCQAQAIIIHQHLSPFFPPLCQVPALLTMRGFVSLLANGFISRLPRFVVVVVAVVVVVVVVVVGFCLFGAFFQVVSTI